MDAMDPSQFADTPADLIAGQQRLYLDRGQAPLDLTQLADVRTLRILKLRVSPLFRSLGRPVDCQPKLVGKPTDRATEDRGQNEYDTIQVSRRMMVIAGCRWEVAGRGE